MKYNKIIFGALALSMTAFAACSDWDDKETASPAASGNGIYFAGDVETEVSVSEAEGTLTLPIYRQATASAASIDLLVTITPFESNSATASLNIQENVSFEAGSNESSISLSYAGLEYKDAFEVTISAPESDNNPYGVSDYTFEFGRPEPWSDWEKVCAGTYTYAAFYSGTGTSNLYYRYNKVDDTRAQYKIESFTYDGYDLIIDIDLTDNSCQVAAGQNMGYYYDDYASYVYCGDVVRYRIDVRGASADDYNYETYPSYYDPETGIFYLYMAYYIPGVGGWTPAFETFACEGFEQPDYSASVRRSGVYTPDNGDDAIVANVTLGADVAYARVAAGDLDAIYEGLADGSCDFIEVNADGTYFIPMNGASGEFHMMVMTFSEDSVSQSYDYVPVEYYPAGVENPWKSLGYISYTDDVVLPLYGYDPISYEVEVQEHSDYPGYFRLMNPYGAEYPYNEEGDYTDFDVNVKVDATDPTGVYIDYQDLGLRWDGDEWDIYSYAAWYMDYGYTLDDVKSYGYTGTYADSTITFPTNTLLVYCGGSSYYANTNGAFCIDFHKAQPEENPASALRRRLVALSKNGFVGRKASAPAGHRINKCIKFEK